MKKGYPYILLFISIFLLSSKFLSAHHKADSILQCIHFPIDPNITPTYNQLYKLLQVTHNEVINSNIETAKGLLEVIIKQKSNNPNIKAYQYQITGYYYFRQGFLEDAIGYYLKSIEICQKNKILDIECFAQINLAFVYMEMDNNIHRECFSHIVYQTLIKAYQVAIQSKEIYLINESLSNIAGFFSDEKSCYHSDSSYKYLSLFENYWQKNKNNPAIGKEDTTFNCFLALCKGGYYYQKKDWENAKKWLLKCEEYEKKKGVYNFAFDYYRVLTLVYMNQSDFKQVDFYMNKMKSFVDEQNMVITQNQTYHYTLYKRYLFQKNYEKALEAYIEFDKIKYDVAEKSLIKYTSLINSRNQLEEAEKEADKLIQDKKDQSKRIKFLIILTIIVFIFLLILFYIVRKLLMLNKKLAEQRLTIEQKKQKIEEYSKLLELEKDRLEETVEVRTKQIEKQKEKEIEIVFKGSHLIRANLARTMGLLTLWENKLIEETFFVNNMKRESEEMDKVLHDIVLKIDS